MFYELNFLKKILSSYIMHQFYLYDAYFLYFNFSYVIVICFQIIYLLLVKLFVV